MNRRDTIIVAVLLNAAIIAVLLIMAVSTDEEVLYDRPAAAAETSAEVSLAQTTQDVQPTILLEPEAVGFEGMLGDYPSSPEEFFIVEDDLGLITNKPTVAEAPAQVPPPSSNEDIKVVNITVKKGDSLDKIARGNGTTIEAIKELNKLKSERLSIGQQLKVPVGSKKAVTASPSVKKIDPKESANAEYYTLKSGDTPWKIAKQQHVSMEDILRLNQLNEEKARNLKVGDKIRIR